MYILARQWNPWAFFHFDHIVGCKTALTNYLPVIYVEQVVVCLVEKDNFRGAVNHRLVKALLFGHASDSA